MILGAELALLLAGYVAATRRVTRWPPWRTACFAAGLGALAAALLALDADRSLTVHMGQHLALAFVAAPLLVLGSPLALALRATGARRALRAAWLARPAVAWCALAATMALTHVPAVHDAALRSAPLHVAVHCAWIAAGVLFWRVVMGADPVPHRPSAIGRVLYLLLFAAPMGATGALLMWSTRPWYSGYGLSDQQDSGALMLIGGGVALAAITVAVAWSAILREHRRQLAYEEATRWA